VRIVAIACAIVVLLTCGTQHLRSSLAERDTRRTISIGFCAAILPAIATFIIARAWWKCQLAPSAWIAAALAIGPWFALPKHIQQHARKPLLFIVVPFVGAACMTRIDLFEHAMVSPIAITVLLSLTGRWLGALAGATITAAPNGKNARVVWLATAAGPQQLAIAAIGAQTWIIPEPLVLGLVLGALGIEVLRHGIARHD
jgi:hypothetical protein